MIDPEAFIEEINFLESNSVEYRGGPSVDELTKFVCVCVFLVYFISTYT